VVRGPWSVVDAGDFRRAAQFRGEARSAKRKNPGDGVRLERLAVGCQRVNRASDGMLAHAMPTSFEWVLLLTVWFAWLWLPIAFLAFAIWRKRVTRLALLLFAIVEIAAISIWMNV